MLSAIRKSFSTVRRRMVVPGQEILAKPSLREMAIPFDDKPFPLGRFEPCCPTPATPPSINGFVPCSKHAMPAVLGRKIDLTDPMPTRGSDRHVVVCVGPNGAEWNKAKVEALKGGMVYKLNEEENMWMKEGNRPMADKELLTTVCDRPDMHANGVDVMFFPEFKIYSSIQPDSLSLSSSFLSTMKSVWQDPSSRVPGGEDMTADAVILVCTHTMRDKRCGVLGPLIVDEFKRVLEEKNLLKNTKKGGVEVWGTSHFGGHKFAGNIIIHQKGLGGHMYGNVRQCHVEDLVDRHIINQKVVRELWRGQVTPP
ncbi:Sucrase/ferredoxin-like-domain-containing protein [Phycomyces nitens]|nr:Sucrase/ferredoxin-like-domain-containing protein [Phycomyces nitens]